jgi:predicted AlkP superfamily phosphohydrolase/phosphomutase
MQQEHFGKQSPRALAALHTSLLRATDQLSDISIDLLGSHAWQFACIVFGATHRAGHYLWDRSQSGELHPASNKPDTASAELAGIYVHADAALGRILEHVPEDTLVVVFAVHGMGPNPGWADLFPDILAQILGQLPGRRPRQGRLYALKRRLPFHWARPVLQALPTEFTDRLVQIWSRNMFDWGRTRWFPLPMDAAGYVRINLRGREAQGIVEPGAEYEAMCSEIEQLVASLRDATSGEAIAGAALRAYLDADPQAPCRSLVPDLIFPWHGPAATSTERLISTQLPGFSYQVPGRLPSGRSGNHTSSAWLVARGPGARSGLFDAVRTVADLLPAILDQLAHAPPATRP